MMEKVCDFILKFRNPTYSNHITQFLTEDPLLLEGILHCGSCDLVDKKQLASHLRNTLVSYKRDFTVLRIFIYREIHSTCKLITVNN